MERVLKKQYAGLRRLWPYLGHLRFAIQRNTMNRLCVIVIAASLLFLGHLAEAQVGTNWAQVTPAAPWAPRYVHAALVFNGRMWVLGGNQGGSYFNDVWSSSDGTNWTQV